MKHPIRRIVHTIFDVNIPPEFANFALLLANEFIDFLTTQTDVYVRSEPIITTTGSLRFRLGLDRNPDQQFPGKKHESVVAYEELLKIE